MHTLPQVPLTILCGEPLDVTVPILDATDAPVAAATLLSARAQIRVRPDSGTVLHEWTTGGPSPNAAITTGGIRLLATAAETQAWQDTWPTHIPLWDLVVVDTTGRPWRVLDPSRITLNPILTR